MEDLLQNAPCGFVSFSDDQTILEANTTLCQWLGCKAQDLEGQPFAAILTLAGRVFCETHIFPLLKLHGRVEEIYLSLRLREGGTIDVLTNAIRRERGGTFASHCAFLPMRQRRQYEDELLQAKKVADEATQAKAKFLSMMSHELRTPMNAILGFGQLLASKEMPASQADSVQQILAAGRHLLSLIDEVLDLSRIEADKLELELEPVPLHDALREVVSMTRPLAEQAGIELLLMANPSDERRVVADKGRLRQVLLNLIANGIKYNRTAGKVSVDCQMVPRSGEDRSEWLRILVRDTGHGIAADKLKRLFTPFDRLGAESTAIQGTGLGLALCKRLAEAMGGCIGVTSVLGEGSCFWLDLPAAPDLPTSGPSLQQVSATSSPMAARGTATLLYIEDNESNRALMKEIFADEAGVTLLLAQNGSTGLKQAREHIPDLILLDLQLPDIPGSEVLESLQRDAPTRDIPVLILTANATDQQNQRLLRAGARAYLTKPFDIDHLLATVRLVLAERTQPRSVFRDGIL